MVGDERHDTAGGSFNCRGLYVRVSLFYRASDTVEGVSEVCMAYEIINGDCLVELPKLAERLDLSETCLVTDPPYGTGGWRRTVAGAGDDPSGSLIVEDWDEGATAWLSLLPASVPVLTFWPSCHALRLLDAANASGRTKHRALYMRKPDPKPMVGGRIKWSVEPVWVLSQDGFCLFGGDDVADEMFVAQQPRMYRNAEATGHPYQKPLSVMRWLISKTTAQTIIDPYAGSGSTGSAKGTALRIANAIRIRARAVPKESEL